MKITFLGAARTVTGSCYLVEAADKHFMVDCGMFQGSARENELNQLPFEVNPADVDFMLLTHPHIDHSGRIPKLYIDGFKGPVYATRAAAELCELMLPDSGHIQEMENEWINRKRLRAGKPPIQPLYTFQDAVDSLSLLKKIPYDQVFSPAGGIEARFRDAGHTLGSAIIELWIEEGGSKTKVVFSGDLGNKGIPILRDPSFIEDADYLVIESTYGNRLHKDITSKADKFLQIINETLERGGNVVIPSFAVGRTQEIIYELNKHHEKNTREMARLFNTPVVVDSPLAASATEVFRKNLDCYDEEARRYIQNGDNPLDFPGLEFTKTADESKALNSREQSMIIISSSGMCEAGRIKHHLKHNLWRSESTVLFVGYQAPGTLGRKLVDGAARVRIFGEEITVKARIESIEGYSGHADRDGLLEWLGGFKQKPRQVFIVHGEPEVMEEFSALVKEKYGIQTVIPSRGESFRLEAVTAVREAAETDMSHQYVRLKVIDLLDFLREEMDEMADGIKQELMNDTDDARVERLAERLEDIMKYMKAAAGTKA